MEDNGIDEYCTVELTTGRHLDCKMGDFERVKLALEEGGYFLTCKDVYDETDIFIRMASVISVSVWTRRGQAKYAAHCLDIKEIGKDLEKPDWDK